MYKWIRIAGLDVRTARCASGTYAPPFTVRVRNEGKFHSRRSAHQGAAREGGLFRISLTYSDVDAPGQDHLQHGRLSRPLREARS